MWLISERRRWIEEHGDSLVWVHSPLMLIPMSQLKLLTRTALSRFLSLRPAIHYRRQISAPKPATMRLLAVEISSRSPGSSDGAGARSSSRTKSVRLEPYPASASNGLYLRERLPHVGGIVAAIPKECLI